MTAAQKKADILKKFRLYLDESQLSLLSTELNLLVTYAKSEDVPAKKNQPVVSSGDDSFF